MKTCALCGNSYGYGNAVPNKYCSDLCKELDKKFDQLTQQFDHMMDAATIDPSKKEEFCKSLSKALEIFANIFEQRQTIAPAILNRLAKYIYRNNPN